MHLTVALICQLSLCLSIGHAANILGIFTSTSRSHIIIHMATIKALTEKGHNVTVVTTLPLVREPNPDYHHIHVSPCDEDDAYYLRMISDAATSTNNIDSIRHLISANVQRVRIQDKALKHPRFQELLNNPGNHFDVVILGFVFNTFQLGVAAHFKCPVIVSWINVPLGNILSFVGNPSAVSSVPVVFFEKSGETMDFRQRVGNFLFYGIVMAIESFTEFKMAQYYVEHFPADKYPSFDEIRKNVSLVFCSTHFSEGIIRPMVPGFVEIGGIQIKDKTSTLPSDILGFLKTADRGFILFSLGTNIKSTDLPNNTTLALFNVLAKVEQRVLWKWDSSEPPGRSPNIMFREWFPQDDLLTHRKLRLFITHAGKGSTVEAQYHGVPMLALPIYGDQFGIAEQIEARGYGKVVNLREVTENNFRSQLQEVLRNTSYLKAVLKFSMLYRDRPMPPKQSVVFWTEYVIRHRGARHMQSPAVHLNFFQHNSLDVIAFIGCVLYICLVVMWIILKVLRGLVSKRKLKVE